MQGDKEVLAYMNELLAGELAARDQYFIHSRMYAEWGYNKLFERLNHEMEEETQHAEDFIHRILMLGGTPKMTPDGLNIGTTVKECLEADLATELHVRAALKKGREIVRRKTRLCYARIDGGSAERHGRRPRALVGTTASLDWHDGRTKLLAKPSVRISRCKETVKLSSS